MEQNQRLNSEEKILLHEKYNNVRTKSFNKDLERLKKGEPLAYIIGTIPFAHTLIHLDSRPLIPRTESEFWIMKAIEHINTLFGEKPLSVLDMFAGSGALGIAWLHHRPQDFVTFAEIEKKHVNTIQKNLNSIPKSQANIVISDVWNSISGTFDVMLANPPYIPRDRKLSHSVTSFEPHEALFANDSGKELLTRFIENIPTHTTKKSHVYIEHDEDQGEYVKKQLQKISEEKIETHNDQYGKKRYTVAHCI